jgi:hypothetical protein
LYVRAEQVSNECLPLEHSAHAAVAATASLLATRETIRAAVRALQCTKRSEDQDSGPEEKHVGREIACHKATNQSSQRGSDESFPRNGELFFSQLCAQRVKTLLRERESCVLLHAPVSPQKRQTGLLRYTPDDSIRGLRPTLLNQSE